MKPHIAIPNRNGSVGGGGYCDLYRKISIPTGVLLAMTRPRFSSQNQAEADAALRRLAREGQFWWDLRHENILPFYGLMNVHGIASAIAYLHSRQIVHGDVKAANVLLDHELVPALYDFGMSKVLGGYSATSIAVKGAGSVQWMSPEPIGNKPKTTRAISTHLITALMAAGHAAYINPPPNEGLWNIMTAMRAEVLPSLVEEQQIPTGGSTQAQQTIIPGPEAVRSPLVLRKAVNSKQRLAPGAEPSSSGARSNVQHQSTRQPKGSKSADIQEILAAVSAAPVHGPPGGGPWTMETDLDLDRSQVPNELKHKGEGWLAVFNPEMRRKLDISLIMTLVHESVVCCVKFSADGKHLATGYNWTAQIYDARTGAKTCTLFHQSPSIKNDLYNRSVRFSPNEALLATGAEDNQIWNIATRSIHQVFTGHLHGVYCVDFSRDGRLLVSGSGDRTARAWNMRDGSHQTLTNIEPPEADSRVTSVAISPDSPYVATGSLDTMARIWGVATGNPIKRLRGHTDSVYSVAFAPNGNGLISGSLDKTLRYWNLAPLISGPQRVAALSRDATVPSAAPFGVQAGGEIGHVLSVVSPEGLWMVSGSKDRGVRFWDAATGSTATQLLVQGHKGPGVTVDLSPVGSAAGGLLATGSGDFMAHVYTKPYHENPPFGRRDNSPLRPPLPPLPPQLANEVANQRTDLVQPKPYRLHGGPGDIAQRLDNQIGYPPQGYGQPPSQYGGYGGPPPPRYNPSPAPPPPPLAAPYPPQSYTPQPYTNVAPPWGGGQQTPPMWSQQAPPPRATPALPPWGTPLPSSPAVQSGSGLPPPSFPDARLSQSLADLSFTPNPHQPQQPPALPQRREPSPPKPNEPPAVVIPLPSIASLSASSPSVSASSDVLVKVRWAKDVLALVDRTQPSAKPSKSAPDAAGKITDPELVKLTDTAIKHILNITGSIGSQVSASVAEALYLRGTLSASGSFPTYLPKDPRAAFKDFDSAARAGYTPGWFKLGRDYESVGDPDRARDCFDRGAALKETSCLYRLGMATLLGQLSVSKNPQTAIALLRQAADQADVDVPQPAYVYGMLLLGEFDQADLPMPIIMSTLPPSSSSNPDPRQAEAKRCIERAAYLNFAPAQYKLGWAYEYAKLGLGFDPLLSVQYYSLASQQGETEADMALSKWFLCGSEGAFEKDEVLAVTFAEKAARKGLAGAEFAMGYYCEVGIGGAIDLGAARKWYQRAATHHNPDAAQRLAALSQPAPETLSRAEHDTLTNTTLVRKRTAAKEYSMASGRGSGERRGNGVEMREAQKLAEAAKQEKESVAMANDGLPMPSYPSGSGNSPAESPKMDGRKPLPPGQHPLPGTAGRFGGAGRGRGQNAGPRHGNTVANTGSSQPPATSRVGEGPVGGRRNNTNQDMPNRQSYALSDDGPISGGKQRPPQNSGNGQQKPASSASPATAPAPAPVQAPAPSPAETPRPSKPSTPGVTKYETFADMGFQSAPVNDKECIIM
ncbi:hypothetical protein FRB97_004716 [Tulasnella sp. 331]|nr:hypothetical protein FRB97_004716 [Tulasnella sp. 331]